MIIAIIIMFLQSVLLTLLSYNLSSKLHIALVRPIRLNLLFSSLGSEFTLYFSRPAKFAFKVSKQGVGLIESGLLQNSNANPVYMNV